jgi:hypothetical protein
MKNPARTAEHVLPDDGTPTAQIDPSSASGVAEPLEVSDGPPLPPPPSDSPTLAIAQPIAVAQATLEEPADEIPDSWWRQWWMQAPSWLMSTVVHLLLVLLLATVTTVHERYGVGSDVAVATNEDGGTGPGDQLQSDAMELSEGLDTSQALLPNQSTELAPSAAIADAIGPISAKLGDGDVDPRLAGGGTEDEGGIGLGGGKGDGAGGGLELRLSGNNRAAMVRSGGGTSESEHAVALALEWLAEHQNYDGSWSFDHRKSPKCHGKCANEGYNASNIAATAMAILPFLGTGQTHREGKHRRAIDLGLKYLLRTMQSQGHGSLWDPNGTMYAHGLASIALCEAYGMTHDQVLEGPAQEAVDFIVFAQDPQGGGWRYQTQTPGDTSVVGWQLMALKSAQMAYLRVPPATMRKAGYFLDFVQGERGAVYGYQRPESRRPATTAIGLLCRMYLGWKHEHRPLQQGVNILSQLGPSTDKTAMRNNMYYNYYATQVLHHYAGYPWQRWNAVMREYLIDSQATKGHERGSWFLDGSDDGAHAGGRLYCTAMAAMTLEVYYRYMPLYRPQSAQGE